MGESGYTGGCRCGAIRYRAMGQPMHHALCHCRDCTRSAGAPMVGWALFSQDLVMVDGRPVDHVSSPGVTRRFCGVCGTGLFYLNDKVFPGQVDIQSATLDDPSPMPAQARIQMADAPDWMVDLDALPGFQRFPE